MQDKYSNKFKGNLMPKHFISEFLSMSQFTEFDILSFLGELNDETKVKYDYFERPIHSDISDQDISEVLKKIVPNVLNKGQDYGRNRSILYGALSNALVSNNERFITALLNATILRDRDILNLMDDAIRYHSSPEVIHAILKKTNTILSDNVVHQLYIAAFIKDKQLFTQSISQLSDRNKHILPLIEYLLIYWNLDVLPEHMKSDQCITDVLYSVASRKDTSTFLAIMNKLSLDQLKKIDIDRIIETKPGLFWLAISKINPEYKKILLDNNHETILNRIKAYSWHLMYTAINNHLNYVEIIKGCCNFEQLLYFAIERCCTGDGMFNTNYLVDFLDVVDVNRLSQINIDRLVFTFFNTKQCAILLENIEPARAVNALKNLPQRGIERISFYDQDNTCKLIPELVDVMLKVFSPGLIQSITELEKLAKNHTRYNDKDVVSILNVIKQAGIGLIAMGINRVVNGSFSFFTQKNTDVQPLFALVKTKMDELASLEESALNGRTTGMTTP